MRPGMLGALLNLPVDALDAITDSACNFFIHDPRPKGWGRSKPNRGKHVSEAASLNDMHESM